MYYYIFIHYIIYIIIHLYYSIFVFIYYYIVLHLYINTFVHLFNRVLKVGEGCLRWTKIELISSIYAQKAEYTILNSLSGHI